MKVTDEARLKSFVENNDFCQLSRSLPVFAGFPPKIIGKKKIHVRIHSLTFSLASFMPSLASSLANLGAGSLSCIFCFIHLVDRDRTVLPRGKWLHFPFLALPLALAWQFVLEVGASASSFLEMVYLG